VNRERNELPLLSVGPNLRGYRLLARHGIHRIATVDAEATRRPMDGKKS